MRVFLLIGLGLIAGLVLSALIVWARQRGRDRD